jgi:hypothetical protein
VAGEKTSGERSGTIQRLGATPLPALPPDSIPAHFSITVGDHQANFMYLTSPLHRSSPARTGTLELKHLLDQFVRLRKQQRDDALPGEK